MSKFVSAIAGLMTVGAIVGYFNSKDMNNQKFNLHLGLITTGLTIGGIGGELSKSIELRTKLKDTEDKFVKEIKALSKEKEDYLSQNKQFSSLFMDKDTNVKELNKQLQQKEQELSSLKQGYQLLEIATKQKITELDTKIARDDDRQDKFIEEVKRVFAESLKVKIDYEYERIADTTVYRLNDKRFEDIHPVLNRFYENLKINHDNHYEELKDIYSLEGDDVIQEVIDTYFRISMEIASLHVKLKNLLNTTTKLTLEVFRDELIERRDPTKFIPKDKVIDGLNHFQTETKVKVDKVRQSVIENNTQLQELRNEVDDFINQIEHKNLEIADLKERLARPMFWNLANSRELEIGNLIIKYFWKNGKGIYLDRSYIESDGYGLVIYFQTDRNPRAIIEKELNEHSEALQQFCRVIKPIEFSYCGAKGLMSAKVVLRDKPKLEVSSSDISRICKPHTKFKSEVVKYERWRITGGSQQGKSPTAQLIINALTEDRKAKNELPVTPRLFNPQYGSKKDNWSIPTEGKGDDECLEGFKTLVGEMKSRQKGTTPKNTFDLFIFDEVDSLYADTKSQEIKKSINYGNKQASHQDIGLLILGQACDANTFGQMTWSDWKSVAMLHLGDNARSYISSKWKDEPEIREEYLKQYRSISSYYEKKNTDAGLDVTSYGYFRFAFIDIPNRKPFFIEIPPFIFNEEVKQVDTTTVQVEIEKTSTTVKPTCPKCGTPSDSPKGKSGRYFCKNDACSQQTFTPKI